MYISVDSQTILMYSGQPTWTVRTKRCIFLPRKPCTERAVSLGWIITFHSGDNGEMSPMHCSALAALVYIVTKSRAEWKLLISAVPPEVVFVVSCV